MKNSLKIPVMVLIMSISGLGTVTAQGSYEGHGLARIDIQRQRTVEGVKPYFEKVLFGTRAQAKECVQTLRHVSRDQLINLIPLDASLQMGEPFDTDHPEKYSISYREIIVGSPEWIDFCEHYEDGYVIDRAQNPAQFVYDNPNKSWASQHKGVRIIATITNRATGSSAWFFADCFNSIHRIVEQRIQTTPCGSCYTPRSQATAGIDNCRIISFQAFPLKIKRGQSSKIDWEMTCSGQLTSDDPLAPGVGPIGPQGSKMVKLDRTTIYNLLTEQGTGRPVKIEVTTWFGRNAAWVIPTGVVVLGGIAYLIFHHGDRVYSTEIQDTTGQSGANGGSGGQHTYFHLIPLGAPLANSASGAGVVNTRFTISHTFNLNWGHK